MVLLNGAADCAVDLHNHTHQQCKHMHQETATLHVLVSAPCRRNKGAKWWSSLDCLLCKAGRQCYAVLYSITLYYA